MLPWKQSAIYSYEWKRNPRCVANLHCECQVLKPKVETNTSFLVLHPSSGVDTAKSVGSHLNGRQAKTTPKKGPSPKRACSQVRCLARIWIVAIQNLLYCRACSNEHYVRQEVKKKFFNKWLSTGHSDIHLVKACCRLPDNTTERSTCPWQPASTFSWAPIKHATKYSNWDLCI